MTGRRARAGLVGRLAVGAGSYVCIEERRAVPRGDGPQPDANGCCASWSRDQTRITGVRSEHTAFARVALRNRAACETRVSVEPDGTGIVRERRPTGAA